MARGGKGTSRSGKGDFRFSIEINPGPRELRRLFRDVGAEAMDFRPAWAKIAHAMSSGIVRNIQSQGAAIGESWPLNDARYTKRKELLGFGSRRLVRTGKALAHMLTTPILARSKARLSVGYRGARWVHMPAINFGSDNTRAHMFMGWNPQMRDEAIRLMAEHVDRSITAAVEQFKRGR